MHYTEWHRPNSFGYWMHISTRLSIFQNSYFEFVYRSTLLGNTFKKSSRAMVALCITVHHKNEITKLDISVSIFPLLAY